MGAVGERVLYSSSILAENRIWIKCSYLKLIPDKEKVVSILRWQDAFIYLPYVDLIGFVIVSGLSDRNRVQKFLSFPLGLKHCALTLKHRCWP